MKIQSALIAAWLAAASAVAPDTRPVCVCACVFVCGLCVCVSVCACVFVCGLCVYV